MFVFQNSKMRETKNSLVSKMAYMYSKHSLKMHFNYFIVVRQRATFKKLQFYLYSMTTNTKYKQKSKKG